MCAHTCVQRRVARCFGVGNVVIKLSLDWLPDAVYCIDQAVACIHGILHACMSRELLATVLTMRLAAQDTQQSWVRRIGMCAFSGQNNWKITCNTYTEYARLNTKGTAYAVIALLYAELQASPAQSRPQDRLQAPTHQPACTHPPACVIRPHRPR